MGNLRRLLRRLNSPINLAKRNGNKAATPVLPADFVALFESYNGGAPVLTQVSTKYLATHDGAAWTKQTDPGGNIALAGSTITFLANASLQAVRRTLATSGAVGQRIRLRWRKISGTGQVRARFNGSQNISSAVSTSGWFTADFTITTAATYIEFFVSGGTGDVVLDARIDLWDVAPASDAYDIIVLAGQSNMAGLSSGSLPIDSYDLPHNLVDMVPGITSSGMLTTGYVNPAGGTGTDTTSMLAAITGARAPLQSRAANSTGDGPGFAFARWYANNKLTGGRKVLIICASLGGTSLLQTNGAWNRSGSTPTCYNWMVSAIASALALNAVNKVVAIYWCQGEADRSNDPSAYATKFADMAGAVRTVCGDATTPIIISGINPNAQDSPANTASMIALQSSLDAAAGPPNAMPNVKVANWNPAWGDGSKSNPTDINDTVHYSTAANRLRGVADAARILGGAP